MQTKQLIKRYLLTTFLITYPAWVIAIIISRVDPDSFFVTLFHLLGGSGPFFGALICWLRLEDKLGYIKKRFQMKHLSWQLWILTFSPLLIGILITWIYYGELTLDPEFTSMGIMYGVGLLFFGPIPEELGWRGILFDQASNRSFWHAQGLTVIAWFLWHLPLFFIMGSYQEQLGFGSIEFILWAATMVIQSLIIGFLYLRSAKSILVPIIFHYLVNLSGEMFMRDIVKDVILMIFYIAILMGFLVNKKVKHDNMS